jgi:superfamily II DNA/RNA helicase
MMTSGSQVLTMELSMSVPTRDDLASRYLEQLPYPPYPLQEEALLAWFSSDRGVLVCAPTGTGKTLIAHAALFESIHSGKTAYYTTPLIALTEQKFRELQECAVQWGFQAEEVGLVTGNRRVNPQAKIIVVVAEILLNRLLHPEHFDFHEVSAVVMDEFHSFADQERGIVWELSLAILPAHVRLLLLSATVGNSAEFLNWLDRCHGRKLELVEGKERKVPLTYLWIPDEFLCDQLVDMAKGTPDNRKTPALVFCFNRDECWSVAEQLKGVPLLDDDQKKRINAEVDALDWPHGVGPKMKQMLRRGVGVHHAGLLPKYRRAVEEFFNKKLLAAVVCTETLAAGINLPARSVVLTRLVKGPAKKQKLIDPSTAQQIFGRAGRPQFDTQGFVYALAHEDDVKIHRWKEKYDQIPEDTRDPNLLKAKKDLKRKKPSRRDGQMYWSEGDFQRLRAAPPGRLYSKGPFPWRLLAYWLKISPEVSRLRGIVRKRLLDESRIAAGEKTLINMLRTLHAGRFVELDPPPPLPTEEKASSPPNSDPHPEGPAGESTRKGSFLFPLPPSTSREGHEAGPKPTSQASQIAQTEVPPPYAPVFARPTPALDSLLAFRSIHPIFGTYLTDLLPLANRDERIQALESVLEVPTSILRYVRVPFPEDLPPGPLATDLLDPQLVQRGLMAAPKAVGTEDEDEEEEFDAFGDRVFPMTLADKLQLYFEVRFPEVDDLKTQGVWIAGELLRFGGNFNKFITSKDLVKQEGIVFRHLLRLILLIGEFTAVPIPDAADPAELAWRADLLDVANQLTEACRGVDPTSTDQMIEQAKVIADVVKSETAKSEQAVELPPLSPAGDGRAFGGIR